MDLSIITERTVGERRVPLTPAGVRTLVREGHDVWFQAGAGEGAGFADAEYLAAGARVGITTREVLTAGDVVVHIHEFTGPELAHVQDRAVLWGFLHLSHCPQPVFDRIREGRMTTVSLDLIQERGRYPVMEPLSAIGGRVAIALAQQQLLGGGGGLLVGGCPGVPPLHVVVLGAGVAGLAAVGEAVRLGARVTLMEVDPLRLLEVGAIQGVETIIASEATISTVVETADILVGAVSRKGEPAPRVLTRAHLRSMRAGGLFVDMSIDEGGCAETSRPTPPDTPVYVEEGVRHLCVPNLPAMVARTASCALSDALLPYLRTLGAHDLDRALQVTPALSHAVQIYRGLVVSHRVAHHRGQEATPLSEILPMV